jgi:hypothetical protein
MSPTQILYSIMLLIKYSIMLTLEEGNKYEQLSLLQESVGKRIQYNLL